MMGQGTSAGGSRPLIGAKMLLHREKIPRWKASFMNTYKYLHRKWTGTWVGVLVPGIPKVLIN